MKKALIFFMALLLIPSMINLTVLAAEAESRGVTVQMDKEIIEIFNNQVEEEEHILRDPSYYTFPDWIDDDHKDKPLYDLNSRPITGQPIIAIYDDHNIFYSDRICSFQDKMEMLDKHTYLIADDEPYLVQYYKYDEPKPSVVMSIYRHENGSSFLPTFMTDLLKLKYNVEILGKQCKIVNIVCVRSRADDGLIYLVTDQGVFVKFYEDYTSEPIVFTEYDFLELAKEYSESPWVDVYDENGNLVKQKTFTEYLQYLEGTYSNETDPPKNKTENIQNNKDDPDSKSRNESASEWLWAIIPAAAVVGIISGAVTYVFMRKKSK